MREESQARVARISGAGHLPGGEYESIHISGSAKIDGDAVCQEDVHVSGAATAKGDLAAKEIHVSGSLQVEGDVHAEAVRISGSAQFAGSMEVCGEMRVSGSTHFAGGMEVCGEMRVSGSAHICKAARIQQLRAAGSLRLDEGVECERFETHGGFAIQGLLNAEKVEIEVGGACQAGEIGGESVRAYRSATANTFLSRLLGGARRASRLSVETIEASQIDLEATRAKVVRGRDVRIGADCEIDRVEYSGTCEIADAAIVRESAKVSA